MGPGLQAARFPWRGVHRNHRSGRVFRDRRAVHRGLWVALRQPFDFNVRLARPSVTGRWPFPRPAMVFTDPVSRGLTFADRTEGWDRGFRPGVATPPGLRPGPMTSSTRGPAGVSRGGGQRPWARPKARSPDPLRPGHRRLPHIASPIRGSWRWHPAGACGGVLPDSSHELLKDPLHRHPQRASTPRAVVSRLPPNGVQRAEACW